MQGSSEPTRIGMSRRVEAVRNLSKFAGESHDGGDYPETREK